MSDGAFHASQDVRVSLVPHGLIHDPNLKSDHIALYATIRSYADFVPRGEDADGAHPGLRKLADLLGWGRNRVRDTIVELRASGWMRVEARERAPYEFTAITIRGERRCLGCAGTASSETGWCWACFRAGRGGGSLSDPGVGLSQTQGGSEPDPGVGPSQTPTEIQIPRAPTEDIQNDVENSNDAGSAPPDFQLVREDDDPARELRSRSSSLMGAFVQMYHGRVDNRTRGRWGAVCRRLVEEHGDDEIRAAARGLREMFPYSDGRPFDPFDLEKNFAKALLTGLEGGMATAEEASDAEWAERQRRRAAGS